MSQFNGTDYTELVGPAGAVSGQYVIISGSTASNRQLVSDMSQIWAQSSMLDIWRLIRRQIRSSTETEMWVQE